MSDNDWVDVPAGQAQGDGEWTDVNTPPPPKDLPQIGVVDTIGRGLARAMPFMNEISAAGDTATSYLPESVKSYIPGINQQDQSGEPIGQRFHENLERQRRLNEAADTQHPVASYGSQIAGAVALPVGAGAKVAGVAGRYVPTAVANSVGSGAVGAGYGALYGAGEGDTLDERLGNAKTGAIIGGAAGSVLPAAGAALGKTGKLIGEKLGILNPEAAASRDIAAAMEKVNQGDVTGMSLPQLVEARNVGQPALPIDVGGQSVKQMAKTAGLFSPEARDILTTELATRAKQQAPRAYDFAENLVGKRLDDPDVLKGIQQAASAANTPAYNAAMAKGSSGVWNSTLESLVNHPWIKKAIPEALEQSNAEAVLNGLPAMKNPFVADASGNLRLPIDANGNQVKPTLEFWDAIKKNIDGKISGATPTPMDRGDPNTVRMGTSLQKAMLGQVDSIVPEYAAARVGAGRYLGEENAYKFGPRFLKSATSQDVNSGMKALQNFTPAEKELAAQGYMSQRVQQYLNRPENQNIATMFSSPTMKAKDVAILGQQKANELEAFMLREQLMNNSLTSLGGSDTARNAIAVAKYAMEHGAGVIGGAGVGAYNAFKEHGLDLREMGTDAAKGAAAGFLLQRGAKMGERKNVEIARQLVSDDPAVWKPVISAIAGNPKSMQALRGAYESSAALAAKAGASANQDNFQDQLPPLNVPVGQLMQRSSGGRAPRKSGGRVITADQLIAMADRAKKSINKTTEPLLRQPDEVVVKALDIAHRNLEANQ